MTDMATLRELHEAGFTPCYIDDLREGDFIAIGHPSEPTGGPMKMTVGRIIDEGHIRKWIGELPDGMKLHCVYANGNDCWRRETS